jgi:peptidoglycan hydrolase CwlO-like protein
VTTWALLAAAPAIAAPDPVPTTTARPDSSPTTTARPDPSSTTTARPDASPTTTARPDPSPTTTARPDSSPTTTARPDPSPTTTARPDASPTTAPPSAPPVARFLTDLQQLYRAAEQATEAYDATTEKLKRRRAEVARLDGQLARTRLDLWSSRVAAGRLARQQYQSSASLSPYVRLLFARDPQHALDEGHLIGQLTRERAATVNQLADAERSADTLARAARKALDDQLTLTDQQKKARDDVEQRLKDIEKRLVSLTPEQLAALTRFEQATAEAAQQTAPASGAPDPERTPTAEATTSSGTVRPEASGQAPATDAR